MQFIIISDRKSFDPTIIFSNNGFSLADLRIFSCIAWKCLALSLKDGKKLEVVIPYRDIKVYNVNKSGFPFGFASKDKKITHLRIMSKIKNKKVFLNEFPYEILDLDGLEFLFISGVNLEEIPKNINKFKNLKLLKLHSCNLNYVSETIGELKNLEILS